MWDGALWCVCCVCGIECVWDVVFYSSPFSSIVILYIYICICVYICIYICMRVCVCLLRG
jgi:hypothetical protein